MVLADIKENHRVFLGPKAVVIKENKEKKEMNIFNQTMERVSDALALNEFFGPMYKNVVLGIIILLTLFGN